MRLINPKSIARFFLCAAAFAAAVMVAGTAAEAANRDQVQRIVVEEALKTSIPPSLALAVAKVESNFKPRALSSAGARGVMQIMPKTGRDLYGVTANQLWKPRLNAKLGIDYLESLIKQYGGRWDLALSHYNGGSKVGKPPHAKVIPYTRKYVDDVLGWQRKYERNATVMAMAEEISRSTQTPVQVASRMGGRMPAYWMFDDPNVVKDWRHYLKVADHWLQKPEDREAEIADNPYAEPEVAPEVTPEVANAGTVEAPDYTASLDASKPSHQLMQRIQERRARFRNHLATGENPWQSRRGRLFGDGPSTSPWTVNES